MGNKRTHTGYYNPKIKSKYVGDKKKIYYRSSWERSFCKWCDSNPKVKKWIIEPFELPYYDEGKKKHRKYNPDFWVQMEDGKTYLIEVKPDYETKPPKMKEGTPKYLIQESTFITNNSKWKAADKFCKRKGWKFIIVTEVEMKQMGIKLLKSIPPMKRKGVSKKNVKYTNKPRSRKSIKKKSSTKTTGRKKVQKGTKACR